MIESELLAFVVSTNILSKYGENDSHLDKLVSLASSSPEIWQTHQDIAVTSPPFPPTSEIENIYRGRLTTMPNETEYEELRVAITQLVDYCALHVDAVVCIVTINGSERSYVVFCGYENKQFKSICVMLGN